jgi:hypothetical protein
MRRVLALSLVLLILASCSRRTTNSTAESDAASGLSRQFETVFYETSQFLSSSAAYDHLSAQETNNLQFPFVYLRGALDALKNHASADLLANSDAVLVGARDFHPPAGLGAVRSQRCYVAILKDGGGFDFRKYLREGPLFSDVGTPVWNWSASLGEFGEGDPKPSSLYATQVGQSFVLVSNDVHELQTLAQQLASPGRNSETSNDIREWASVSKHEVWGYRRYRHVGIADPMAAGMADVTGSAEELIFFVQPDHKTLVLQLFAEDQGTAERINAGMTKARIAWSPLGPSGTGSWDSTIRLSGDENSAELTFIVVGLFGFAVYL